MCVNIFINVKGRAGKIISMPYIYNFKEGPVQVSDFLDETVRITLEKQNQAPADTKNKETGDPDRNKDKRDVLVSDLQLLSEEEIEDEAASGKITFGIHYNTRKISVEKACRNARQCFADGMVALFVDGERYESLTDSIRLNEGSQVTFVRLTFLTGRMW